MENKKDLPEMIQLFKEEFEETLNDFFGLTYFGASTVLISNNLSNFP